MTLCFNYLKVQLTDALTEISLVIVLGAFPHSALSCPFLGVLGAETRHPSRVTAQKQGRETAGQADITKVKAENSANRGLSPFPGDRRYLLRGRRDA